MRRSAALSAALLLAACNALLDAGEPVIVEETPEDVDPPGPPGECGGGACDGGADATGGGGCGECAVECDGPRERFDPDSSICYLFAEPELAWEAARDACASWGGRLSVIDSEPAYTFVQNRIVVDTWIGARAVDEAYAWIDGETFGYAPWAPGHPSGGACVHVAGDLTGFRDDDCQLPLAHLCERPPPGQRAK